MESGELLSLHEIEKGFREAALRGGNILFTQFLSGIKETAPICSDCGVPMKNLGARSKKIVSLLGEGLISRNYYGCKCRNYSLPKDELLDIENTSFTPGIRRAVSQLAASESFEHSSATLEDICGIYVSGKDTERIAEAAGTAIEAEKAAQIEEAFSADGIQQPPHPPISIMYIEYDGTGVPVMKREVADRKGKQEDGTAKTREVKLGCIFTQTGMNEKNEPVRDKGSTSYFGSIETSASFGKRLYMEAVQRGVPSAKTVVVIGDGAKWVWNLAEEHFPGAVQIVDLYHAREHLTELIKAACLNTQTHETLKKEWYTLLDAGDIYGLTSEMGLLVEKNPGKQEDIVREINYFKENAERMKYAYYKRHGYFVGSGVIEAGCKNVIGKRLKQSGMHWSVRGANAITALRCAILSDIYKMNKPQSKIA